MSERVSLYSSIHKSREVDHKIYNRIMLTGYFNEEEVKRQNLNIEQYINNSLSSFRQVKSYTYIKGVFYIQLLESQNIVAINQYLSKFQQTLQQHPLLVHVNRIIHQSYENTQQLFKGVQFDNHPQPGPILSETEKTQEQIQDRSFEIYELFIEGALMKMNNPSHRIGNMIVLSNEDMSILNCDRFMNLRQYLKIYTQQMNLERQQESNYPVPPSFFDIMEYLEIDNYENYRNTKFARN